MAYGCGVQDEAANHGEDGRVGADAKGESEGGDEGECGFVEQKPRGEAEIAKERLGKRESVLLANEFFRLFQSSEFAESEAAGLLLRETLLEVIVDVQL
jgi:hypothetical protein